MMRIWLAGWIALFATTAFSQKVVPVENDPANSPREALRKKLFAETLDKPACKVVDTKPEGTVPVDAELTGFLKLVIESLEKKEGKTLRPLFHQRMNVGVAQINQLVTELHNVYREPFDVSLYKLWALNTVDGATKGLPCDGDRLTLFPLFGYPLQFGAWMQIMGQKELGRIYMTLVPADGRWNIGSFHVQQWTHDGKDFATWAEDAEKLSRMGHKMAAWVKFDIASKLLDGGGLMDTEMRKEVIAARDGIMSREDWDKQVRAALSDWNVVYTASIIAEGGAGVMARLGIPKEISANDVLADCGKIAERLYKEDWAKHLAGVRCSYVIGKEDPSKDGKLGGVYLSFATLKEKDSL